LTRVFITGIAGFLGSHLADKFIKEGYEVSGIDNLIGGDVKNIPSEVNYNLGDCSDFGLMKKLLSGVDIVYHTACTAHEGLSVFSPSLICQNTYQNSITTISASIQNKVKRFVYCSSMSRYGSQDVTPFVESMETNPQDPYAISKVASETALKMLSNIHGMDYVIAVPHNIIGPRQKYDDPFRNVASIMINRMLQGNQPIIYGDGSHKRCFSFIDDCISCLFEMAVKEEVVGEVINIGPDEEYITIKELAETISSILGFDLEPIYYPDRPAEVKYATCSSNKARKLLNYKTKTSLRDGLIELINDIKSEGTKPFKYHIDLEIINEITPKTWLNQKI